MTFYWTVSTDHASLVTIKMSYTSSAINSRLTRQTRSGCDIGVWVVSETTSHSGLIYKQPFYLIQLLSLDLTFTECEIRGTTKIRRSYGQDKYENY